MSIIVYDDVILDECVFIAGASGIQNRLNERSVNQGGYATVNSVRDVTLRQFDFGVKPMFIEEWEEVEGCYEVTDAGTFGFLVKDPKDQTMTATDGALQGYVSGVEFGAPGFGNGGPLYGVRKLYKARSSSRVKARPITRPNGTWTVSRNGTPVTVGVAAGNISLSAAPVYVTFVPDATRAVTAVTVGATTEVTLATAMPSLPVGGYLWLQGFTGADAALLNNIPHLISNITGGGLNVYTLATNTAGKTITVGSGVGHRYAQPTEALAVVGDFYVPVHFATDNLDWDIVKPGPFEERLVQGPSFSIIEIREA